MAKRGNRVAREWARSDLAVVDERGEPLAVVELKACYTHDVAWGWKPTYRAQQAILGGATAFETLLRVDAEKATRAAGQADGYLILIAMHRRDAVPLNLRNVIAESGRGVANQEAAERQLVSYIAGLGPVSARVSLGEGTAFGVGAAVGAWLCGPLRPTLQWAHERRQRSGNNLGKRI